MSNTTDKKQSNPFDWPRMVPFVLIILATIFTINANLSANTNTILSGDDQLTKRADNILANLGNASSYDRIWAHLVKGYFLDLNGSYHQITNEYNDIMNMYKFEIQNNNLSVNYIDDKAVVDDATKFVTELNEKIKYTDTMTNNTTYKNNIFSTIKEYFIKYVNTNNLMMIKAIITENSSSLETAKSKFLPYVYDAKLAFDILPSLWFIDKILNEVMQPTLFNKQDAHCNGSICTLRELNEIDSKIEDSKQNYSIIMPKYSMIENVFSLTDQIKKFVQTLINFFSYALGIVPILIILIFNIFLKDSLKPKEINSDVTH